MDITKRQITFNGFEEKSDGEKIELLNRIIDSEIAKDDSEIDLDLIQECSDYIKELLPDSEKSKEAELAAIRDSIKQGKGKKRKRLTVRHELPGKKRRWLRITAIAAASFAIFFVTMSVAAIATGHSNVFEFVSSVAEDFLHPEPEETIIPDFEGMTPEMKQRLIEKVESREATREAAVEYCKEVINDQCPEFASVPWDKCWVDIYGGGFSKRDTDTVWTFFIWYSIDGHKTAERVNVSFEAYPDGGFGPGHLASEHIGEYSKFDELITEDSFRKAAAELNGKMDKILEACGSDTEKEAVWLTICDNPKGVEDYSKLYRFTVNDGKLLMVMGSNKDISSILVG